MMIKRSKLFYFGFLVLFLVTVFTGDESIVFPFSYTAEIIVLLSAVMLLDGTTRRYLFQRRANKGLLGLFLLQVLLLTAQYGFASLYPEKTLTFLIRHLSLLPFFFCTLRETYWKKLLDASRKYIIALDVVYLALYVIQGNNGSFLGSYQYVATYSSLLVLFKLAKMFSSDKKPTTRDNIELLLGAGVLLMTGKRSFVLVLAAIFAVGMLFIRGKYKEARVMRVAIPAVAGGAALMILQPKLLAAITRLLELGEDTSLSGRTRLWSMALGLWREHRWLGIGYGCFSTFTANNRELVYRQYGVQRTYATHNIYLQLLAETGVVGLVLFSVFFIACLVACAKRLKRAMAQQNTRQKDALVLALFVQLWFLIYGLSGNPLYMASQIELYLFAVMLAFSADRYGEAPAAPTPPI